MFLLIWGVLGTANFTSARPGLRTGLNFRRETRVSSRLDEGGDSILGAKLRNSHLIFFPVQSSKKTALGLAKNWVLRGGLQHGD
jgi:hypothetical protein